MAVERVEKTVIDQVGDLAALAMPAQLSHTCLLVGDALTHVRMLDGRVTHHTDRSRFSGFPTRTLRRESQADGIWGQNRGQPIAGRGGCSTA